MKLKTKTIVFTLLALSFYVASCKKSNESGGSAVNLFTIDDDISFGKKTVTQIESNPTEYPILNRDQYSVAYEHIERITASILNSGKLAYRNQFEWKVKLINKNVLNAFCTPGGYIYVYTGLIKYLDDEASLAGVMGHEIAHADNRHATNQMTKQYGTQTLLSILTGNDKNQMADLVTSLILLKYSREDETDADKFSVVFLNATDYDPQGAKYFFEKISASSQNIVPEFLSTHPSPDNRIQQITNKWIELGSKVGQKYDIRYQEFKNALPVQYQ